MSGLQRGYNTQDGIPHTFQSALDIYAAVGNPTASVVGPAWTPEFDPPVVGMVVDQVKLLQTIGPNADDTRTGNWLGANVVPATRPTPAAGGYVERGFSWKS